MGYTKHFKTKSKSKINLGCSRKDDDDYNKDTYSDNKKWLPAVNENAL